MVLDTAAEPIYHRHRWASVHFSLLYICHTVRMPPMYRYLAVERLADRCPGPSLPCAGCSSCCSPVWRSEGAAGKRRPR
jgi:hypothetical protein